MMRWHVVIDTIDDVGNIWEVKFLPHLTVYFVTIVLLEMIKMTFWECGEGGARIWTYQTVNSFLIAVAGRNTPNQYIVKLD